jgi:hypothetical protein
MNLKLIEDVHLLIPHLGSIGDNELKKMDKDLNKGSWQEEELLYGNHLGVLGVLRVITQIKPKVALISEFGEELKSFRGRLLQLMQGVIDKVMDVAGKPRLLPADLPFVYNIKDGAVFCLATKKMKPAEKMCFEEEAGTFYYFAEKSTLRKDRSLKDQYAATPKPHFPAKVYRSYSAGPS